MIQNLEVAFDNLIRRPYSSGLAADVRRLSDFYIEHTGEPTPWDLDFAASAYLAYFLPLNYARLRAVMTEVVRAGLPESTREIWDFGSGLGTTQWVLEDTPEIAPVPLFCVERSPEAKAIHRELAEQRRGRWDPQFVKVGERKPARGAAAIFSYSFLEMRAQLPDLEQFDHLIVLEPSHREGSRELMRWRGEQLSKGYNVLAPCTHVADCPLLVNSPRDWCHQRIGFAPPDWWLELEAELPMKNRTLTYSYLVMSRTVTSRLGPGTLRVIGDTRVERGKTKQAICRGPRREFLSWLHRFGEAPRLDHGQLLADVSAHADIKGDELRLDPNLRL